MGKTKVADKSSKKEKKSEVSGVKAGRVTKAAETPKAKSKATGKAAGAAVEKEVKKSSKKAKKEPTPEPSSDESESEADSDSDSEIPDAPAAKAESSDSDSSDSESEEEEKPAAKAAAKAESSDSDSDSDSESEAEKPAAKADASDSDSDSDSDSSDSDSAPSKKRKAEEAAEPAVKKTKTEEAPAAAQGIANLFVGSLSWNIDEDWLRREFEHFGTITGCRVISDRETGRSKGFGYVEFESAADAAKAQKEMMGYELDGRALNVDFSTPREKPANKTFDRANKFGDKRSAPSNTLFLGNLSFDCTNEIVQETFQEYGSVSRVSLPTDRETGALKGFGYVDFSSTEEATAALEALNGADIAGRAIRLDYAAARDDSNSGGRGGGFGGGRGGRGGGFGGGRGGRGGFGDRGGRGGRGGGRGGFGDRGGRGGRGGGSFNRGGFGDFKGSKVSFD